jgi:hypothetical protein
MEIDGKKVKELGGVQVFADNDWNSSLLKI